MCRGLLEFGFCSSRAITLLIADLPNDLIDGPSPLEVSFGISVTQATNQQGFEPKGWFMRTSALVYVCGLLLAVSATPSYLYADAFCSEGPPFQYQACGVVAAGNTFTVNSAGAESGVFGFFEGFHADFGSSVYALLFRNGTQIARTARSATNQDLTVDQRLNFFSPLGIVPPEQGDTVEFVLDDQTDPNGEQLFYSQRYATLNSDHLNHTWAENLSGANCAPGQGSTCLFIGFEDIPQQEGSDFDYNDFKMWAYGLDLGPGATQLPEPSSLLLLTGAPLAFVVRKLRVRRKRSSDLD